LVVDPDDQAQVDQVFNSGGAGMFAKPQEYTSEAPPYSNLCESIKHTDSY
jgi:hypothetical protein